MVVIVAGEMADVGGKVEEEDGDFDFEEDGGGEADLSRIIGFGSVLLLSGLMEKVEILSFLCFGCKWAEQVLRGQCRGFDNFADDCEEEEAGEAGYSGGRDDAKVLIPATVVLSNMFSPAEMRGNLSSELETDVLLESMKLGPVESVKVLYKSKLFQARARNDLPASLNPKMQLGSTGHTLKHMLGFLRSKNIDEINSKSRKMMAVAASGGVRSSENVGNGPILTMVNGAWVDRRFPLVSKYKEEVLKDGLQNLIEKLNSDSGFLSQEYFDLTEEKLDEFWIPKFKFSFDFNILEVDFNVLEVMDDMGKAYIEVDEKGTEAVAITQFHCVGSCAWSQPVIKRYNFVADHPFVFMIREERSGLILFSGAVLNPIKED
ncbi:hypothetical protein C3L33_10985, partial [Rhododendron williamsianum]